MCRINCILSNSQVLSHGFVQPRMHEFFGLGTTHFCEVDVETGAKEVLKLRVHSLLIKLHDGKACVYWKEFMRDKTWQPENGSGWPAFKEGVDLDLASLQPMPTPPINGFADVEKRVLVGLLSFAYCLLLKVHPNTNGQHQDAYCCC